MKIEVTIHGMQELIDAIKGKLTEDDACALAWLAWDHERRTRRLERIDQSTPNEK